MFGTAGAAGVLNARINNGGTIAETPLPAGFLGAPHRYQIEWGAGSVRFLVDGTLVHVHTGGLVGTMRPIVSDFGSAGGSLAIDWLRMSPYAASGTFSSRIFDAGEAVGWQQLSADSVVPADTSLSFEARSGDVAVPDASWSAWLPISGGGDLDLTSRYLQYRATLGTINTALSPALRSVTLSYGEAPADTTAPTITARSPLDGAVDVARDTAVTVTFSEPMNATTIDDTSFTLRAVGAGSDVPASVAYASGIATLTPDAPLAYATDYTATVSGSVADLAGNPLGANASWTFTTADAPVSTLTDTTIADFGAGTTAGTYVSHTADGEVILAPTVGAEFDGSSLPAGWIGSPWDGGAAPTVASGAVTLDQDMVATSGFYTPGRSVEFVATFSAQNQHAGFALDFNNGEWAIFSSGATGDQLYARSLIGSGATNARTGCWLSQCAASLSHRLVHCGGDLLH